MSPCPRAKTAVSNPNCNTRHLLIDVRFKLSAGACGFGVEYLDEEGAPIVFRR
jgi:hypothetical protein